MTKNEFIEAIAGYVRKYAPEYNILVYSPIIAQAILESGWGETKLASDYHNYFGLKCGSKWTGPSVNLKTYEEYTPGVHTEIRDNFRVYSNMEEGVKGYFEFIQLARYANLKGITDPVTYLETIKADGYATSSTYVEKNYKLITQYDLTKYDKEVNPMAILFGSARIDERGDIVNGTAGDQRQTGTPDYSGEVSMQDFYVHSKGWYVLRPKDANIAEAIAKKMYTACNNKNIGYDQNGRAGVLKYGVNSTTPTEADCSSLVRACVKEASGKDPGEFYTGNEVGVLEASGLFEKHFTYTGSTKLYNGDVLVTCSTGHTGIIVSGSPRVASKPETTTTTTPKNTSGGLSKTPKFVAKVTASALNVRTWAGVENPNLKSYPVLYKGNLVDVCDTVKAKDGGVWYYIRIAGKVFGFASANYLARV